VVRHIHASLVLTKSASGCAFDVTKQSQICLRNHLGEEAIQKAKTGDFFEIDTLLHLLHSPYDEHSGYDRYANFPPSWASSIEISCSS